jgi:hypothetical protein
MVSRRPTSRGGHSRSRAESNTSAPMHSRPADSGTRTRASVPNRRETFRFPASSSGRSSSFEATTLRPGPPPGSSRRTHAPASAPRPGSSGRDSRRGQPAPVNRREPASRSGEVSPPPWCARLKWKGADGDSAGCHRVARSISRHSQLRCSVNSISSSTASAGRRAKRAASSASRLSNEAGRGRGNPATRGILPASGASW